MSSEAQREAPPVNALYWAKRTMGYGGEELSRGQVFKLKELANDATLFDLGYVALVPKGSSTFACRACGKEFIDMRTRDTHAHHVHETGDYVPPPAPTLQPGESQLDFQNRHDAWAQTVGREADAREVQRDDAEAEVAPLDLTKTEASRSA